MAQVLPYVQSPLEQLMPYIGQLGQGVRDIGTKIQTNKKTENFNKTVNDPNATDIQIANAFSQLPKETKEFSGPLYTQAIKARGEQAKKSQELQQTREGLKSSIDFLEEALPYTGARFGGGKALLRNVPGTEAFAKAKEFDSTGFWVTDNVYTHFNKGTVSDAKLELIKKDLSPRSDLFESENRARINSLKRIMALPADISKEKFDAIVDKEVKSVKGESPSGSKSLQSIWYE